MRNFNRDNRDRGRRDGGFNNRNSRRNFGGSQRPSMHSAICDACQSSCEVPFKPTGNKPIYCSSCFEKQGGSSRQNKFGGGRDRKPRFENRDDNRSGQSHEEILKGIKALNYKLDELIKVLGEKTPAKKITTKEKKAPAKKVVKKKVVKKKAPAKKVVKKKVVKKKK